VAHFKNVPHLINMYNMILLQAMMAAPILLLVIGVVIFLIVSFTLYICKVIFPGSNVFKKLNVFKISLMIILMIYILIIYKFQHFEGPWIN